MINQDAYLSHLIRTKLLVLLTKISPPLAEKVEKYVETFTTEAELAQVVGDLTGPFWSLFDTLTRACILKSPDIDMQYLLIYPATTRTTNQLAVFGQAFDLIFGDLLQRLQQMESKKVLAAYIQHVLDMDNGEKLTFWQSRMDMLDPTFLDMLKRVVYAPDGPYAQTQGEALDILLMMRPFLMSDLSGRQNTNELMQQSLYLVERISAVHRFDLIRALNNLYPEIVKVDINPNDIIDQLGWQKENFVQNIMELIQDSSKRNLVIDKIEQHSKETTGTSAVGIFMQCKARLKSELNIELSKSMIIEAFQNGRIKMTDIMGLLGKVLSAVKEESADDESNAVTPPSKQNSGALGNLFGNFDVDDIISQVMQAVVINGAPLPELDNPPVD